MLLIIHTNFVCPSILLSRALPLEMIFFSSFGSTNNLFHYDRSKVLSHSFSRAICINILDFIKCYVPSSFKLIQRKKMCFNFFGPSPPAILSYSLLTYFFRCCSLFNEINLYLRTCETCEYVRLLHGGCCEILIMENSMC